MRPLLEGGETILWRENGKQDAGPGDLLLYGFVAGDSGRGSRPQSASDALAEVPLVLAVHRVMRRHESSEGVRFVTKGDGRPAHDLEPVLLEDAIGLVYAFERAGVRWSLEGRGARFYARLAWFTSRVLAPAYRAAALADALLRRLVLGRFDVFVFRPLLAALQRAKHGFFHTLLFRACHNAREVDVADAGGEMP